MPTFDKQPDIKSTSNTSNQSVQQQQPSQQPPPKNEPITPPSTQQPSDMDGNTSNQQAPISTATPRVTSSNSSLTPSTSFENLRGGIFPSPYRSRFDSMSLSPDEELLHFAQIQALRDEELSKARQQIQQLHSALHEADEMDRLHREQEKVLKEEIRELERAKKREGANLDYLKNIVLKYMLTDEQQSLVPVLATILQFSPDELDMVKKKIATGSAWWGSILTTPTTSSPKKT
jgi:hypothetical protein